MVVDFLETTHEVFELRDILSYQLAELGQRVLNVIISECLRQGLLGREERVAPFFRVGYAGGKDFRDDSLADLAGKLGPQSRLACI